MQLFNNGDLVSSGRLDVQGEAEFKGGLTLVGSTVSSASVQNAGTPSPDDEATDSRRAVLSVQANGGTWPWRMWVPV